MHNIFGPQLPHWVIVIGLDITSIQYVEVIYGNLYECI